jgi:hypothetical protein
VVKNFNLCKIYLFIFQQYPRYCIKCTEQDLKYLGHFEFGLDHKPWNDPEYFDNFNNINYWLEQWILFYKYIFEKFENYKNCHFIIYEKLFDIAYIERILEKVKVDKKKFLKIDYFRNYNKNEIPINYDKK